MHLLREAVLWVLVLVACANASAEGVQAYLDKLGKSTVAPLVAGSPVLAEYEIRVNRSQVNVPVVHAAPLFSPFKMAVLTEFLVDERIERILLHFASVLPAEWSLAIVYCDENAAYVQGLAKLLPMVSSGRLRLVRMLESGPADGEAFSALLLRTSFWRMFAAEKLLLFHTDAIICSKSRFQIDDFLEYDFVGAPWKSPGFGRFFFVGNGGFSLRSRTAMERIADAGYVAGAYEDAWIAWKMHSQPSRYRVAPALVAGDFACEKYFTPGCLGAHGVYKYMRKQELAAFYEYCPEAVLAEPDDKRILHLEYTQTDELVPGRAPPTVEFFYPSHPLKLAIMIVSEASASAVAERAGANAAKAVTRAAHRALVQMYRALPNDWPFLILCTGASCDHVDTMLKLAHESDGVSGDRVQAMRGDEILAATPSHPSWSDDERIRSSFSLWRSIAAEKVLFFDLFTHTCAKHAIFKAPERMASVLAYDYIAAPFHPPGYGHSTSAPSYVQVGSASVSLRSRSVMLRLMERTGLVPGISESVWLSMALAGGSLLSREDPAYTLGPVSIAPVHVAGEFACLERAHSQCALWHESAHGVPPTSWCPNREQ